MDLSIFLAKAWGLYITAVTLALITNKSNFKLLFETYRHSAVVFFSGAVELLVGILTVISHNVWTWDYQGLITLFGWAALVRGLVRLFAPATASGWIRKYEKSGTVIYFLIAAIIIGLYLIGVGFGLI